MHRDAAQSHSDKTACENTLFMQRVAYLYLGYVMTTVEMVSR